MKKIFFIAGIIVVLAGVVWLIIKISKSSKNQQATKQADYVDTLFSLCFRYLWNYKNLTTKA